MSALVEGRTCGACAVCCRVPAIAELAKPAGPLCRHSTAAGCGIYPARPVACARWHCLWRRVGALPDALRPDRSGVLFALEARAPVSGAPEGACIVGRIVGEPGRRGRRGVAAAFAMFAGGGGLPVWRVSGRRAVRVPPPCGPAPLAVGRGIDA